MGEFNEGMYDATQIAGCFNLLTGFMFMMAGKKIVMENFEKGAFKGKVTTSGEEFKRMCGLLFHTLYILGNLAWAIGIINLGMALKLDATLCILPAASILTTQLIFMRVMNMSPVGIPDFNGPPIPAFVITFGMTAMFAVNAAINWDALMNRSSKMLDGTERNDAVSFAVLCVVALLVPHAIGFKHRSDGWMEGFVVKSDAIGPA